MGKKIQAKKVQNKKKQVKSAQQNQFTNFQQIEDYVALKKEQFEFDECINLLNKFLGYSKNKAETVRALDMLGEIYMESMNPVSAISCFEKSISLDATNPTTFMSLGQLYGIDPPSSTISNATQSKSYVCYMKGIEVLLHRLSQAPQNEQIKFELSMAYCSIAELYMTDLCDLPDAEQSCRKALENADLYSPNNPHVLQDWASFLITTHQRDAAERKLQQVVEVIVQFADIPLAPQQSIQENQQQQNIKEVLTYDFQLGTCRMLQELGRPDLSKPILQRLLLQYDEFPDVWYMLGQVYAHENNENAYKSHLLKAMELAKGDYFEVEIRNELIERFGEKYMENAVNVDEVVEDVIVEEGEGNDDDEWSDVDSDEDME